LAYVPERIVRSEWGTAPLAVYDGSMRVTLLLSMVTATACHRPADLVPTTKANAPDVQLRATPEPITSVVTPSEQPVIDAWNDAHKQRGAFAFEAVYAPRVRFYGTELSAANAAKRKAAALAATTDYQQTIGKVEYLADGHDTWARFVKSTTAKGKKNDYAMLLIIDATHHITEEGDDVASDPQWCTRLVDIPEWVGSGGYGDNHTRDDWHPPSQRVELADRVPWPFRVGAASATTATTRSKHAAAIGATAEVKPGAVVCATRCPNADVTCGYHFPLERRDGAHEWVYVDPVTKRLAWEGYDPAGSAVFAFEPL
jgi:hypothetical protein